MIFLEVFAFYKDVWNLVIFDWERNKKKLFSRLFIWSLVKDIKNWDFFTKGTQEEDQQWIGLSNWILPGLGWLLPGEHISFK